MTTINSADALRKHLHQYVAERDDYYVDDPADERFIHGAIQLAVEIAERNVNAGKTWRAVTERAEVSADAALDTVLDFRQEE